MFFKDYRKKENCEFQNQARSTRLLMIEKKLILKKLCRTLKGVMLSEFLVVCILLLLLLLDIKLNKYGGDTVF